jgi:hypothetical protein
MGDISFVGQCSLQRSFKYFGFIKYPALQDIIRTTLLEGMQLKLVG